MRENWTLTATSARHAAERGEHPAILCEDRVVTYDQLHRESNRTAHRLLAAGLGVGDRVAYLGLESEHYYEIALGCAKAGVVLVPVNWRLTADEVDHILRDSGAALLFVEREFLAIAEKIAVPTIVEMDAVARGAGFQDWKGDASAADLAAATGPDDAILQIYTSGTTGFPKGVVLANRAFFTLPAAQAGAGVSWLDWLPSDRSLISLPGFGIAGMGWFMHGFNAGATNVVMRMFISEEAVKLIERVGVTTTFAAPAMLQMMIEERGVTRETFRSLRKVAYGAAPISSELLERLIDMMGCEFAQIYAATETGTCAVCLPPEDHVPGSPLLKAAGKACPGHELKVIDPAGNELPPGEIGQVCIRTPAHMLGYWNLPEATAKTLVGDWLHMGDAGYLDENGYVYLCDRINDTIIQGGQNIYPAEIERALAGHPAVQDSAVIGLPHPLWGEAVHACVVLRPGETATARELMVYLSGRIADYKIPTEWEFPDSVPRNPSGKILRRVLREERMTERASR
ncbi:long-chain-fatty-acid--CoA ligase [Actinokineospora sp. UTMC 2448]|uniref:long-chain-fatty-acid--CoA ligase n=1 Tax=Actinokineospora sp. UTMC 2448 TaxID=2268449 RepID=UPI002164E3E2|nr:long-chain-fatty-acid--CoA ligase [Actinokineospora sp. UTMC 2448]UVS82002.1 Long-chain-fatty-acid--CoA ligase FadD13 [Actinokineospora sp. UTMC 2448]